MASISPRTRSRGAAVRVENLSKRFGDVVAVAGVNLYIGAGEFLTLLGPSGSGKTTTLLMLAGFQEPTSGDILFDDRVVTRMPPYRRDIGMVFQNYALFPHMTVFDNISYPLRVRRLPQAETKRLVGEALELVHLPGLEHRYPAQLSGGQQQRVALARALVYNPLVLLMDEPLGALDKKLREAMQIEIKRIQRETNATVVYVTHDQEEALVMSDRIAVMNHGSVQQITTPKELYETPTNRFVADFVGEVNFLSGTVRAVDGELCTVELKGGLVVRASAPTHCKADQPVAVAVRPERMALGPCGASNALEALVEDHIYLGESMKYRVRLANGEQVVVKVPGRQPAAFVVGSRTAVGWAPTDARILEQ